MSSINYTPYKKPGTKTIYTEKETKELFQCYTSPGYFIENFIKIRHPNPAKGIIPFKMYPYQKNLIANIDHYKNVCLLWSRQIGKTEIVASYILWYAMFHPGVTVLIVANKLKQALEIMERIRFSYQELPDHIRDSAVEFNKSSIIFSNGSKIVCRATTPDAGRGLSVSLLYIDELSFVRASIQNEFWSAIQPVLSTGGRCIVTSTPGNDEDIFAQIWRGAMDNIDANGNLMDIGSNGFKGFKAIWSDHPDRDEVWVKEERAKMADEYKFRREHCCEFLSFDETLIDPMALSNLKCMDPKYTLGQVRWYKDIDPSKTYIAALDPSAGVGQDFATIEVFEMPGMVQVGEWMSNKSPPKDQIKVMLSILKFLKSKVVGEAMDYDGEVDPNIFWSFENNSYGEAIISLILEMGEDIFPGSLINEPKVKGHVKRYRRGLHTTSKSKILACTKLKTFIDSGRMKINSPGLINQLKNYVASGPSFAGKIGSKDDLVSASLIAVRIMLLTAEWGAFSSSVLREVVDEEEDEPLMPIIVIN